MKKRKIDYNKISHYKGDRVDIKPTSDNITMIIAGRTIEMTSFNSGPSPAFLIVYNDDIYFGICYQHTFQFFDDYQDLD